MGSSWWNKYVRVLSYAVKKIDSLRNPKTLCQKYPSYLVVVGVETLDDVEDDDVDAELDVEALIEM